MKKIFDKVILWVMLLGRISHDQAYGVGFSAGPAAVDTMSDKLEPAASVRLGWTDGLYSQLYYWGKDFGPVEERNYALTFVGQSPLTGMNFFHIHYGVVGTLHELTLYGNESFRDDITMPPKTRDRDGNLGGVLGMGLLGRFGILQLGVNWDSHVFLTGSPFIIFLASARKQTVSALIGIDL